MYEKITDRARKVMQSANREAMRFKHEYIGTEDLLLGLIAPEIGGVVPVILKNLGLDLETIRSEVEKVAKGPSDTIWKKLPQYPRAKKVIDCAIQEARSLGHDYVGTEHLLLGLMRDTDGLAAEVLMRLGLSLAGVRDEVLNVLGLPSDTAREGGATTETAKPTEDPNGVIHHLPEAAQEIVRLFDHQIELIKQVKELAVSAQEWQRAASMLDIEHALKKLRTRFIDQWPKNL